MGSTYHMQGTVLTRVRMYLYLRIACTAQTLPTTKPRLAPVAVQHQLQPHMPVRADPHTTQIALSEQIRPVLHTCLVSKGTQSTPAVPNITHRTASCAMVMQANSAMMTRINSHTIWQGRALLYGEHTHVRTPRRHSAPDVSRHGTNDQTRHGRVSPCSEPTTPCQEDRLHLLMM
jgi:hypothetical protein